MIPDSEVLIKLAVWAAHYKLSPILNGELSTLLFFELSS
jgi:hypothetical protein